MADEKAKSRPGISMNKGNDLNGISRDRNGKPEKWKTPENSDNFLRHERQECNVCPGFEYVNEE